jgi:hypothetical protein
MDEDYFRRPPPDTVAEVRALQWGVKRQRFRDNTKRMVLTVVLAMILSFIAGQSHDLLVICGCYGLLFGWMLWGMWSLLWPGACVVCGTRRGRRLSLPGPTYRVKPWWDLRAPSRSEVFWICTDDLSHAVVDWIGPEAERGERPHD